MLLLLLLVLSDILGPSQLGSGAGGGRGKWGQICEGRFVIVVVGVVVIIVVVVVIVVVVAVVVVVVVVVHSGSKSARG